MRHNKPSIRVFVEKTISMHKISFYPKILLKKKSI